MLQVKMQSKVAENPFYGKSAMKTLLNQAKTCGSKPGMYSMLDAAWKEAKENRTLRECFFIICFSIGEITNRQHNIFGKAKVDNGGNAARPQAMWIMSWIRSNHPTQYYNFMFKRIINEFISFFVILACQIRTLKGKKNINYLDTETYSALKEHNLDKVAEFLATTIKKGSIIDRMMLAKWLVVPRFSNRQAVDKKTKEQKGTRELQPETIKLMTVKQELLLKLSALMNWEVVKHPKNWKFIGFLEWRKDYNMDFESILFSTGRIRGLDREQFFNLLNTCPSGARYRIRRRLLTGEGQLKGKWFSVFGNVDMGLWYKDWENFKVVKQQEERVLTEKIRQGTATEEDKVKVEQVKKEAKVNVGGVSLMEQLDVLMTGKADNTVLHSILNKINFEVPVIVINDVSSSMSGRPSFIAALLTTVTMLKNPSVDLDNMLFTFGAQCNIYTDKSKIGVSNNRFVTGQVTATVDKLIDRTMDFSWNFSNIFKFTRPIEGNTDFSTVAIKLRNWIESEPELKQHKIEQLQQYPVFVVVSDGDLNSHPSQAQSMSAFINIMQHYGWNGVVVVWNINTNHSGKDIFEGIPNVIHYYGYNLGIINQIFTNIHDLDVIDIYTELKSLHASNRYSVIKEAVL